VSDVGKRMLGPGGAHDQPRRPTCTEPMEHRKENSIRAAHANAYRNSRVRW
jgi:hypothetical protein